MVLLVTAGCATVAAPSETATPAADPTSAAEATTPQTTDEDTCMAFGDVITIMNNSQAAVTDGRMGEQEQLGWLRLATRVQDRIPTTGEGPIADALAAVQAAAPAIPPGSTDTPGIRSDGWMTASTDLREACDAAGYEFASEGFVGG